jgi:hypothetical protein
MENPKHWSRRDMLRASGIFAVSAAMSKSILGKDIETKELRLEDDPRHVKLDKPMKFIIIGFGGRGSLYASYSEKHPEDMKVEGVADIVEFRRNKAQTKYGINKK